MSTPTVQWFGNGRYDFRPHGHTRAPYGITGDSDGPFVRARSYPPPTPYGYRPRGL